MRGRQIFTRANIYVSDLGDLAVPMRPASGSRGLRAPHLAAVTRRSVCGCRAFVLWFDIFEVLGLLKGPKQKYITQAQLRVVTQKNKF